MVADSAARLEVEFPTVSPEVIRELLESSLARTTDARVQHFRLVLAEREVREQLER